MLTSAVLDRASGTIIVDVGVRGTEVRLGELTDSLAMSILRAMGRDRAIAATRRGSLVARSLPALREFLRGEQFYRRDQVDSAMAHYHQALVEDPDLAMAHRRLGWLIAANQEVGAAYGSWRAEVARAIALNHGLDPRDSLLLLADSLKLAIDQSSSPDGAMRDWFTRTALLEEAGRRFPFDAAIWAELGEARFHEQSPLIDRPGDAFAAFKRAVGLDPGYAQAYWHIVDLAFRAGQPMLAVRHARAASRLGRTGQTGSMALTALVLDSGITAPATRRAISAASPNALFETANNRLGWAADSAEAAVVLLRELAARDDPVARAMTIEPNLRLRFVAIALAFRGHLHAAAATGLARASDPAAFGVDAWNDPFAELAMLGVVADTIAHVEFARAFDETLSWGKALNPSGNPRFLRGVPWWYQRGDTVSLRRLEARAGAVATAFGTPVARLRGRYYASIAPAYIALARGDSMGARRRLEAVPDSLCVAAPCLQEKWLLARLLVASGDDPGAARLLDHWSMDPLPGNTPSQVLIELERGGIAERLADTLRARRAYQFVADVWHDADPELQRYVRSAREGRARVGGRR
jgi:tetratricopeptide (TPR) repeat protein